MLKIQDKKTNFPEKVKKLYKSGEYFNEAYNWYAIRFLSPYSDRVFFSFLFIIGVIIIYVVIMTIYHIFPLKESFPILVKQYDASIYRANVVKLRPKNLKYTSSESLGRYFSIYYLKTLLDNYDYGNDLTAMKTKLAILKKFSTAETYNKASSYLNDYTKLKFQNNRREKLILKNAKFIKNSKIKTNNFYKIEFLYDLQITDNNIKKPLINNYKIILTFKFNNIKYDKVKDEFDPIVYIVNDFEIIKLK